MNQPDLFSVTDEDAMPYNGTAGAVHQSASQERAHTEATSGIAKARATKVLDTLNIIADGLTYQELGKHLDLHHGQSSGALSTLHKAGLVFMTHERRNRCQVYVHARYKHNYKDTERIDTPAQTKAGKRKDDLEQLLHLVEKALAMGRVQDSEIAKQINILKETS